MINALISILICAALASAAYYASYRWVNLRHNRDTIVDELQRATAHIEDLEARIALMEAEKSLNEYRNMPKGSNDPFSMFEPRQN